MISLRSHFSAALLVPLVLSAMLVLPNIVSAQEKLSLTVKPSLIEEKVDPGQVIQKEVTVTNFSTAVQKLYLSSKNITDVAGNGTPIFAKEGEATPYDVSSWVTFNTTSVALSPGESKIIPITIIVPKEIGPGGHYGGVFFSENPPDVTQSGTGVGYQVGVLLNLRVSGVVDEQIAVREFRTSNLVYGKDNVEFAAKVENTGNILVRPRGPIDIINMFGRKVDTLRMNDAAAAVFPKGIRVFTLGWESKDVHFGRYTARLVLSFGDTAIQNTTPSVTSFWVLPSNIIIPAAIFLLFFIMITWILMRLYVARRLRELSSYSPQGSSRGGGGMSRLAAITIALLLSIIIMLVVIFTVF